MEAVFHESEELDETGTGKTARVEIGNERTRRVVERWSITYERGVPEYFDRCGLISLLDQLRKLQFSM